MNDGYSVSKITDYLYQVTYKQIAPYQPVGIHLGQCSSFVKDGKLYRSLDWNYDEGASFHVLCEQFEGMSFLEGLTNEHLDNFLIEQLPYHVVDGVNHHGIMVSTHVLFNDWGAVGKGKNPLTSLPYLVLTRVNTMATIADDLGDVLNDLQTSSDSPPVYLIQVLISDGHTTALLRPKEVSNCQYELIDITSNPKLANFRWVDSPIVVRSNLQNRPTGIERWNMMPCDLPELRFTKAYETPERLSEFIGSRGTTKNSSDEDLMHVYKIANVLYKNRKRDGTTWQTMHSVVYGPSGMEHLWIQENWGVDYMENGNAELMTSAFGHDGIKGMKWGIRRYQNKDGSLTPLGKERYSKSRNVDRRSPGELSDEELRERINRLELESRYTKLYSEVSATTASKGKAFVMDILSKSGSNIGNQLVTYAMGTLVNKLAGSEIVNPKKGQKKD